MYAEKNKNMINASLKLSLVYLICYGVRPDQTIVKYSNCFIINVTIYSAYYEGNVCVKRGSEWGLVCDDEWSIENGHVVCRQLGLGKAIKVTTYNRYNSSRVGKKCTIKNSALFAQLCAEFN